MGEVVVTKGIYGSNTPEFVYHYRYRLSRLFLFLTSIIVFTTVIIFNTVIVYQGVEPP
jgi:hypothetical protein